MTIVCLQFLTLPWQLRNDMQVYPNFEFLYLILHCNDIVMLGSIFSSSTFIVPHATNSLDPFLPLLIALSRLTFGGHMRAAEATRSARAVGLLSFIVICSLQNRLILGERALNI